jgi:hypothetical protein
MAFNRDHSLVLFNALTSGAGCSCLLPGVALQLSTLTKLLPSVMFSWWVSLLPTMLLSTCDRLYKEEGRLICAQCPMPLRSS